MLSYCPYCEKLTETVIEISDYNTRMNKVECSCEECSSFKYQYLEYKEGKNGNQN